ncbi:uncharacterized protein A1O9_04547 [Exophiala aquamarina CBS 119918]|uniref:Zn(2)-C6 fungal-type domain-containing protein n=1 Tax=Exophiala aquamarina CBS 119918 TaxID=1182545 RepID=A0A072PIK8_9EURO|nr:uncharacterized protein A1O9_04547 [Exophiala aquamarina CBS 119918]KEF59701.1 hypothetical protein A1O9_04547 [Exophiala aquamarina CBS 119918]
MQTPASEPNVEQTRQVCTSCKARKRKCDKALPKCGSCTKRGLPCEYSAPQQILTPPPMLELPWYGFLTHNDRVNTHSIDFPTILFLDPGILRHGQLELRYTVGQVPEHFLHLLGDMNAINSTAAKFFRHIHRWMPFISKKRFYEHGEESSFYSQPDTVLLLLCIQLITAFPPIQPRNARTPLYHAAKHLYLEVEGSSIFALPVLQAGVLLALYELGHAIYPAAYLTIGACARYAYALGINIGATVNTRKVLSLVELEERRRVWWALVILDRFNFVFAGKRNTVLLTINKDSLPLAAPGDLLQQQIQE